MRVGCNSPQFFELLGSRRDEWRRRGRRVHSLSVSLSHFQDFKIIFNARWGRKKEINKEDSNLDRNGMYSDGNAIKSADLKYPSDMAVFEQFEQQERHHETKVAANSGRSDGAFRCFRTPELADPSCSSPSKASCPVLATRPSLIDSHAARSCVLVTAAAGTSNRLPFLILLLRLDDLSTTTPVQDPVLQLKPLLPPFDSAETRSLAETLCRDILRSSPDVKWETIKGLENAKRLVKEAVVMPIKYPKYVLLITSQKSANTFRELLGILPGLMMAVLYFKGLLSPWKGILLFGPPGTGKDKNFRNGRGLTQIRSDQTITSVTGRKRTLVNHANGLREGSAQENARYLCKSDEGISCNQTDEKWRESSSIFLSANKGGGKPIPLISEIGTKTRGRRNHRFNERRVLDRYPLDTAAGRARRAPVGSLEHKKGRKSHSPKLPTTVGEEGGVDGSPRVGGDDAEGF
ncbi:Katanin p60 ATPase-containing subunit A1 [Platanthera guangdongensis]|uniref:Katanin p60 ATPase-containing subunit A1 n=1 Tax=Platanthera guangdongensis TaxID=2320717 RepID=A0ABR2N3S5_9ASPA